VKLSLRRAIIKTLICVQGGSVALEGNQKQDHLKKYGVILMVLF